MSALIAIAAATFLPRLPHASAASNGILNFQARLENASGAIVPDGYYNIQFKLYNVSSGGTALWTESYIDTNGATAGNDFRVQVINGYASVNLGSLTAFPGSISWDQDLWLTMNIGGTAQTSLPSYDGEMNPRMKLTAVPYAFQAKSATQLQTLQGAYSGTLDFSTMTASRSIHLPDEDGTVCLQNSTNCGFLTGSAASGSYIQLQGSTPGTPQTGNFNITGTGIAGILQSTTLTVSGSATFGGTTLIKPTQVAIKNTDPAQRALTLQAATGQSVDLFSMYDAGGSFVSGYDANGNIFANGSLNLGTATSAGTFKLKDGTGFTTTLKPAAQTGSYTISLPTVTANDTICTVGLANCGSSGGSYITLQTATPGAADVGNFNITGTGIADVLQGTTKVVTSSLDTATATTLNVGATTASAVNIGKNGGTVTIQGGTSSSWKVISGSFRTTVNFATPTVNNTISFPNESGTICLQNSSNCGFLTGSAANSSYIQLQGATPGTAQTGNFNITGTGIAGVLQAGSLDTVSAGTLSIGNTNATTINLGTNAAAHTIAIGTGAAAQAITIGSTTGTSSLVVQSGSGGMTFNSSPASTGGYYFNINGSLVTSINSSGDFKYKSASPSVSAFTVQDASRTVFTVDTQNELVNAYYLQSQIGITSPNIQLNDSVGGNPATYVSPLGTNIQARLTIKTYDPTVYHTQIAAGLPSTASQNASSIMLFDARTTNHRPTISVLSPDETQVMGLSWEGTSTTAYLKSSSNGLNFRTNDLDVFSVLNSTGASIARVGVANGSNGSLQFANATNGNTATLQATGTTASYATNLPTAIGTAGQCLYIASVASSTQNLGYTTCGGGGSGVTTVGTFSATSLTNGASIAGNTITFGPADGTKPGMVSTTTQTFAGAKTFTGDTSILNTSDVALLVQDSGGNALLTADTLMQQVLFGQSGAYNGKLALANSSNANTVTITTGATSSSYSLSLPTVVGSANQCLMNSATPGVLTWGSCGGGGSYVSLQGATPGTADVGNFNINGTGIANILQATSFDRASAGILSIGATNATTVNIATNNIAHTINIGTGTGTQTVKIGSADVGSSLALQTGSGGFSLNTSGANTFTSDNIGRVVFRPTSNTAGTFKIQNADGSVTIFNVDTTAGAEGVYLTRLLQTSAAIQTGSFLNMTVGSTTSYLTPGGANVPTKINVVAYNPGDYGQVLAMGIPSTSLATSRVVSLFDARTSAHQPTISVFNPAEDNVFGLSWDGSNTTGLVKNTAANIGINVSGSTVATFNATTGLNLNTGNAASMILNINGGATAQGFYSGTFDTATANSAVLIGENSSRVSLGQFSGSNKLVVSAETGYVRADSGNGFWQVDSSGMAVGRNNATNSATAFTVLQASGNAILTADSSAGQVLFGKASALTGKLVIANSTNANTITITSGATSASYTITLPTSAGAASQCLMNSATPGVLTWGTCGSGGGSGSGGTQTITLIPEFVGATFSTSDGSGASSGNNTGYMTSDYAKVSSAEGYKHNYYQWYTDQATAQDYHIITQYQLPSNFTSFAAGSWTAWSYRTSTAGSIGYTIYDAQGNSCSSGTLSFSGSASTWYQSAMNNPSTTAPCTFAANDIITIDFKLIAQSPSTNYTRLGEVRFSYN